MDLDRMAVSLTTTSPWLQLARIYLVLNLTHMLRTMLPWRERELAFIRRQERLLHLLSPCNTIYMPQ